MTSHHPGTRSNQPRARRPIHGRCWDEHPANAHPCPGGDGMPRAAHRTIRVAGFVRSSPTWASAWRPSGRFGAGHHRGADRWRAATLHLCERSHPMARLRLVLLTLAVAALLLVGTASAALAGIAVTGLD